MKLNFIANKLIIFILAAFVLLWAMGAQVSWAEDDEGLDSIAGPVAEQLNAIKKAAQLYYLDQDRWPNSLDVLKNGDYLPTDFDDTTTWGAKYTVELVGDELAIDLQMPDPNTLSEIINAVKTFDAASQTDKKVADVEVAFAESEFTQSLASVAEETDNTGTEAFDKPNNLEQNNLVKSLTITNDEAFLTNIRRGIINEGDPTDYIRLSISKSQSQAQFDTDQEKLIFNRGAEFLGNLVVSKITDKESADFFVDPSQTSSLGAIKVSKITDRDNEQFALDLSGTSNINQLTGQNIQAESLVVADLETELLNGSPPVSLGQLSGFAVTQLSAGKNMFVGTNGLPTSVGSLTVSVIPNPEFNTLTTNENLTVGGNANIAQNVSVGGALDVQGSGSIAQNLAVAENFTVEGNTSIGDAASDQFTVNGTAQFLQDVNINNQAALTFGDTGSRLSSLSSGELNIESPNRIDLTSSTIQLDATDKLLFNANQVDLTGLLDVTSNVSVSGDLVVNGNVQLGADSNLLTINSAIQGSTPLIFEGGAQAGRYVWQLGDPNADIVLRMPVETGDLLVLDTENNLTLPGALQVTEGIEQTNSEATNTLAGALNINNTLSVTSGTNTPIVATRTDAGKLLSLNANGSEIGVYGLNASPESTLSASIGSIGINMTDGAIYVNHDNATEWARLLKFGEGLVQGGDSFGETYTIGSLDEQGVNIITSGTTALAIDTSQNVSLSANLNIEDALTVKGNTSLQGNVILGDANTDQVTITGTIQNDLRFKGAATGDITLARSAPDTDITLTLPAISGTMVALDSVNNNLSLPNQLNVTNGIKQTASTAVNTLAGKLEINNDLAVSTVDETVASFTRSNVGELLAFSVDGGANSFGLYAVSGAPTSTDAGIGSLGVNVEAGDLYIKKTTEWLRLPTADEVVINKGNAFGEVMKIGTTDNYALELTTNNITALTIADDQNIAISNDLTIANDLQVEGDISGATLNVSGDTSLEGDVTLGDTNTDKLTINSVIQNNLVFQAGTNQITLVNSSPTTDITLNMPSASGTLLAMGDNAATSSVVETNHLSLPNTLTVANAITQTSNTATNVFKGAVSIDNGLTVSGGSDATLTIVKSSGALISIDNDADSSVDLSVYLDDTPAAAGVGSINIDTSSGNLSIKRAITGGGSTWRELLTSQSGIVDGGNALGETIEIGTTDNFGLELITNNITALTIANDQNVTLSNNLNVNKDLTATGDISSATLDISGATTLDGNVTLGDASTDEINIKGTIQGDIKWDNTTIKEPTGTQTLALPAQSGTLLALTNATESVPATASVSGNLQVAGSGGITQTDATVTNNFAGNLTLSNGLEVNATGATAAQFATNQAHIANFTFGSVGSSNSFGLYGTTGAPTATANTGSLSVDTRNGDLYIRGSSAWKKFTTGDDVVYIGGNSVSSPLSLGTINSQGLNLITNNTNALAIAAGGAVTVSENLTIDKQLTVSEAINAQSTLTVAGASNLNGPVTLGDARTDNITIKGTIKDDLKLEGTTITPADGVTVTLNLPNASGTLLSTNSSGDLSLTGTLSAANLTQSSSTSTNTFAGATTINNTLAVSSGTNTPLSLTTTGNQLLSLTSGDGGLGIYAADDITSISGANPGSLGLDRSGELYVRKTSEWARLVTGNDILLSGGNAPTSTLKIGTTNANNVELIANNTVGLSLTSAGNVSIAKGLTLSGGGINQTSTTANAFAGSMTIAGSTRINNTLTVASGSNIPVSLQRTSAGQFLSFSDGSNSFGLYSTTGTGAPTLGTGSIGVSTTDGHLYLGLSGGASRVLTEADNVILQGGNALSGGALNIGTTSGSGVNVIVNGNNALSFNTSGAASFANALSVTGVTSLANTNITGSLSLSSSSLSVPGETAGATATLTLPNRTGTLLTDQDEVSNIASNSIENTQLSAGSFSKITGVGTLSSLNVSSGISAASLSLSSVAAGSSSALDLCLEETSVVTCSSLGALKRDIVPLNMGSETLMKLTPRQFKWQGDGQADIGFIAEEVAAVNPILAQYDAQGDLKGVKYRHLTALLTKVLQSQQVQLSSINQAANFASGRLGVGRAAHNDYRLDVAGQVRASGFIESSDARLKQNIQTIPTGLGEGVLGRLAQIDGVYYDWNHTYRNLNGNASVAPQVGVLAQQVEAVLPRIVETDSRGYKTVAYSKLTPYLLEGLKELNEDLEPLREALQVGENGLNIQADKLQFSDIVLSGDADRFQVKRSRSLSNLMSVSTRKVADTKAQGYISAKDVYLADANMWGSETTSKMVMADAPPKAKECSKESQKGDMRFVSGADRIYICNGKSGWLSTQLNAS